VSDSLVDWRLATRVAGGVAGGDAPGHPGPRPLRAGSLVATCEEAEQLVRGYAQLDADAGIPAPEAIGRSAWSAAMISTLRDLATEVERENEVRISLPGPLGSIARSLVGVATGTEVGLAAGYASRRVLGQYDVALVGSERPPRLLFVAPNLAGAANDLDTDLDAFVRWVALHETTHALQFATAPWLREHLGGLARKLLSATLAGAGIGDLARRVVADPKGAISSVMRANLAAAIASPEQAAILDRIQATMTVIEGHAEHVMDAAAGEFVADVPALRRRIEARRSGRGPLEAILSRLLGLDLKLRQYKLGKEFCDAVAERGGIEAVNRIWSSPEALPTVIELRAPDAWLERTSAPAHA
jgi:coenzyme F420 biosynthesis associated uncharacterized protein